MQKEEIEKEISMSYEELVQYLIEKYGPAQCDYFPNEACKSKSKKVTRTSEGLYCHHIKEDEYDLLSTTTAALNAPFECQKKENLVYCNLFEHMLLHISIQIKRQKRQDTRSSLCAPEMNTFTINGLAMVQTDLNEMYFRVEPYTDWHKNCYDLIRDNYEEYVIVLKALYEYVKEIHYIKNPSCGAPSILEVGISAKFDLRNISTITEIAEDYSYITVKKQDGTIMNLGTMSIFGLPFVDGLNVFIHSLCLGYEKYYKRLLDDIQNCNAPECVEYKNIFLKRYNEII